MEEYLRRNLVVAKAFGVRSGLAAIAVRMNKRTDCPMWLKKIISSEIVKMEDVIKTLIEHREEIKQEGEG